MTYSKRYLQKLTLCCICTLACSPTLAQTAEHACGNQERVQTGPDFRTFRALANPAINAPSAPRVPTTVAAKDSGVVQASHDTPAKSAPARKSPSASRIPSTIVMDPDVATIRLMNTSDEITVEPPALRPVPTHSPIHASTLASTLAPAQPPPRPTDLLSKLTSQSARNANASNQPVTAGPGSQPICAPDNAPKHAPTVEPFATLTEADSRGTPKNWDISTRRPKVVDEIGADGLSLAAPREFAPTPKQFDTYNGEANVALTSASETVSDEKTGGDVPFWVQPSLLGNPESNPVGKFPAVEENEKPTVLAEFEIVENEENGVVRPPSTAKPQSNEQFEKLPMPAPIEIGDPKPASPPAVKLVKSRELEVAQPATVPEPSQAEPPQSNKKSENWASMPSPGRPEDNPAPEVEAKPEPQPRRWAGLFVQDVNNEARSKTYMTQVAFDQPITDSTIPGDNLFAQANTPRKPRSTGRRRMRLNFLDDPGERAGDPTRDAIKSLLEADKDESGDLPSLLDDLEDETSTYEERYRYAFEDVIEPLPIKKTQRNYAPTLKDIFADEEETNPEIERAFCGLMWSCAGGKCMTPMDRMKRSYRRNYALFYSPCDTQVCRPMDGFEQRVRAMTPPQQPVPATTPQLSPAPQATPVPGLPRSEGPIQSLPNASAWIPTAALN